MPSRGSEPATVETSRHRRAVLVLDAPAAVESVDLVQDLVADLYARTEDDLSFTDRMRYESALVEIVANVVEHGTTAAGRPLSLHVVLRREERDLWAEITDDGEPFVVDLARITMSSAENEGGRGLAMARALSSELTYDRRGTLNVWTVRCTCAD